MNYHIAIVDDTAADAAHVRLLCEDWAAVRGHTLHSHLFESAEHFLFCAEDLPPFDILLLDIEMGEMNGVELSRRVRARDERVQMVFITGYPDFVAEGYEVAALHYLMKPVEREKLAQVLDRAAVALSKRARTVLLPVGKEAITLAVDEIRWAESQGHYMHIHTAHEVYRCRMTLPELTDLLGEGFARCHRSYLVGLRHIRRITRTDVHLDGEPPLPLGRGMYDELNRALIQYLKEM